MEGNGKEVVEKLTIGLLIAALFIVAFNVVEMRGITGDAVSAPAIMESMEQIAPNTVQRESIDVLPKGVPNIYGAELGVSYNDISASDPRKAEEAIARLSSLESIRLDDAGMERYIAIATQISCEYCCGAEAIIFSNGQAACGCSHSSAMRGVAKYLLKNHGDEFTNDEILEELGKWKTLFFPQKLGEKAAVLKEKGISLTYINLASNKYRGIENEAVSQASGAGMVGGC